MRQVGFPQPSDPEFDNRSLFVQYMLGELMVAFSRVVHSIVCCRILLNLRQAATPRGPSTILESISLQFAAPPEQETNQVETIQLETYSVRGDGKNSCQQADEEFAEGHS